jgi:hypothetical protein
MSYDKDKYDALRSAGVPSKLALALTKDTVPNLGADPDRTVARPPIEKLPENANQKQNPEKLNEIIDVLNEVLEFEES